MTATFGIILAGGGGRRLGGVDKAFVTLAGRPLVAHVVDRLGGQVGALAVSVAGDGARFSGLGVAVVADGAHAGKGPLAGVLAGMRWAAALGGEAVVSVPVDTPFVPRDVVARLGAAPAVAAYGERLHHLVAVWPVVAADALAAFLRGDGPYRVSDFARGLGQRVVRFEAAGDPFVNINTPADLAAAAGVAC
ncbi:molybdenum cofactor guanylyltransferase MobA [Acidiphilium sp.]|uniref:molybdenum cofactor guanylyltransferase MobA n=1 Tax=Acidiphilium sp. TaxID=527 RepID=UPI003D043FE6